jgi:hypothetical protein
VKIIFFSKIIKREIEIGTDSEKGRRMEGCMDGQTKGEVDKQKNR